MSYHPEIALVYLIKPTKLWEFNFSLTNDKAYHLTQTLEEYEDGSLFECQHISQYSSTPAHWRINVQGMKLLIPHFTNWEEMREKAFSSDRETWQCANCLSTTIHARCLCHDAPFCLEHFSAHVYPKRDNSTYAYRFEFLDKDGNPVKCHTCSSLNLYNYCLCHTMPLCSTCYRAHMDEEQRKHQRASSSQQQERVNIRFGVHDDTIDAFKTAFEFGRAMNDIQHSGYQERWTGTFVPNVEDILREQHSPDYVRQREAQRRFEREKQEQERKKREEAKQKQQEEFEAWMRQFRSQFHYSFFDESQSHTSYSTSSSSTTVNTVSEAYRVLGVSQSASSDEVKKAYRKVAREAHPDSGGSHEKMVKVNSAYEIVSRHKGIK